MAKYRLLLTYNYFIEYKTQNSWQQEHSYTRTHWIRRSTSGNTKNSKTNIYKDERCSDDGGPADIAVVWAFL